MTQLSERSPESLATVTSFDPETRKEIIALIERVRACQIPATGAIDPARLDEAVPALTEAVTLLRPYINIFPSLATCLDDMEDWLAEGLDQVPNMRHLVKHGLAQTAEGEEDIFLSVTTTLNYREGFSLEFVHFRRFNGAPAAALRQIYFCSYLMIAHLIDATAGFGMESNCIVTFTECLAGGYNFPDVMDVFFTSKNALRGKVILQPIMEKILAPNSFSELRAASLDDLRLVVPCKTVTHEWSHRQGVLPLTECRIFLDNPIGAGLEEARVELNGAHILYTHAEQGGPFARYYEMAAQFIIADRIFRYPYSAHPSDNADAVSGQYFFGQFADKGLLTCNAGGVTFVSRNEMIPGLKRILEEITQTLYAAVMSSPEHGHRIIREHVATYSKALDANNVMQRTVFYLWLEGKLKGHVPQSMDWKAAIEEYGE